MKNLFWHGPKQIKLLDLQIVTKGFEDERTTAHHLHYKLYYLANISDVGFRLCWDEFGWLWTISQNVT